MTHDMENGRRTHAGIFKNGETDLTRGGITGSILMFAFPMIAGNLLQQCYNIADTIIVGRFAGPDALAAVGSSYTLMTFLLSVIIGLCMGSGVLFSMKFGAGDRAGLRKSVFTSFVLIGTVSLFITALTLSLLSPVIRLMNVPEEVFPDMKIYLAVICAGIPFTFLYNFLAFLLRSAGNSITPLWFLGIAVVLNIILDMVFIPVLGMGTAGAALATVISQIFSAAALARHTIRKYPELAAVRREEMKLEKKELGLISGYSFLTCVQQSVMNFGILMIQGLVNTFGTAVMAAFATAVKIDSFAYMPVQDFGNAFSTFIAQNYGAGKEERIRKGLKSAVLSSSVFSLAVSALIFIFAGDLMKMFVGNEPNVIGTGTRYLRIEGSFYIGIAWLFLLYGLFRAVGRPGFSLVLTVISLGLRVAVAYVMAPDHGIDWIWWAIPIGWFAADAAGILFWYAVRRRGKLLVLLQTTVFFIAAFNGI